jgi:hypothetical protein
VRERDCEPVPHDLVHVVHALNALTVQWIGQGVPQVWASWRCGQCLPPFSGCRSERLRVCTPTPHETVHVVHGFQLPMMQSMAHVLVLHARVSV